ncbi:MAG: mannose-6-phosphate isomerase, class I [Ilumatobacteraceae bacterium]|nr:mannose-6-phosphate isomerase, class I [Ilumatobacteraceae bacterium]
MPPIATPITGVIQHYDWGDHEFIPKLLNQQPDGRPWAELWLGTHKNGPAHLAKGAPLADLTGELPFLLKVLAAEHPLSLQVHPSAEQAVDGHRRGVYPDANAKPELLCALTHFEALCGVRPVAGSVEILNNLGCHDLAATLRYAGPQEVITDLYRGAADPARYIAACGTSDLPEARWIRKLNERYPGDPSVAVALLLNYVTLVPGEALHLTAGNLHAYLGGVGIELMGASDNVVRGGLTSKFVDVEELLTIVDLTPLVEPVMTAAAKTGRYPLPEAGCELVRVEAGGSHTSTGHELALSLDGTASYLPVGSTYSPTDTSYVVVSTPPAK